MKRHILLTSFLVCAAAPALAGDSVITIGSASTGANSVITIDCSSCPPLKPKERGSTVHGVEVIETEIGGEKKIVQTDNLMGGSPVRYVKASTTGQQSAGEEIAHSNGGTNVTVGHEGTIQIRPGTQPVTVQAGSQTTFSGGGEFHVEEVKPKDRENVGVDDGSRTSSVNMNDAEHDIEGGEQVDSGQMEDGTKIIELRPTQ